MAWYVIRRVLQMIPVFFGATFLVYFLVFSMPGDPIAALGGNKPLSPAVQDRLRAEYNLDEPLLTQYFLYLQGLVQGDFGTTFAGRPVIDDIRSAFPVTARLAVIAIIFEAVLGILGGVVSGLRKGTWIDTTLLVTSILVIAVPTFVIGFVAQFVFGVKLGWVTINVGADVTWGTLLLPGMVLGAVSFAYVLRLTRTQITETMTADHVRTATAKGLSRPRVINVHILRNSLIPVITFLGVDLGQLMGGAIVTEGIFNIPGLGFHLFDAIQRGESTKMVSMVTLLVIIFIVSNLIIDLLYALLDPRIRYDART
ncbi:ABC transporter permease [Brachybacterium fresconis]|uniref:Oligopeptide transport system permease protein n=1 Tax=Brachybacterium fresconis TaxID=173363 RepID=A0ABS4YPX4_9MICO|nr:ABC transporter permease [Brachybacterium fresconis]MBP2410841.1 oligopeptide transport system permease protein [Brachybacterium fresconis]